MLHNAVVRRQKQGPSERHLETSFQAPDHPEVCDFALHYGFREDLRLRLAGRFRHKWPI